MLSGKNGHARTIVGLHCQYVFQTTHAILAVRCRQNIWQNTGRNNCQVTLSQQMSERVQVLISECRVKNCRRCHNSILGPIIRLSQLLVAWIGSLRLKDKGISSSALLWQRKCDSMTRLNRCEEIWEQSLRASQHHIIGWIQLSWATLSTWVRPTVYMLANESWFVQRRSGKRQSESDRNIGACSLGGRLARAVQSKNTRQNSWEKEASFGAAGADLMTEQM